MNDINMGRFYAGDIDGKFWFAIQSTDDGEHFGAMEQETTHTTYYADDLKKVEAGLKECNKKLKGFKKKIDEFFKEHDSYNDKQLAEYLDVIETKAKDLLTQYARLELGEKIYKCVKEQGYCSFDAEH